MAFDLTTQDTFEWMGIECPLFKEKYDRVVVPDFRTKGGQVDLDAKEAWEDEEWRRIAEGWGPFSAGHYFYYNYARILSGSGGKIRPELRMTDNLRFRMMEQAERDCTGYVMPKGRRRGATWGEASDCVRQCLLYQHVSFGYASMDEPKGFDFIRRCAVVFDNLPDFLKVNLLHRNRNNLEFAEELRTKRGRMISGNQSIIESRAPGNEIWESSGRKKVIQDEAGKLPPEVDLRAWLEYTKPTLAGDDGFTRAGVIGIFGTAGEMDEGPGKRLQEVYENAGKHKLIPFFVPGYFGVVMDQYGNDDFEAAMAKIEEERQNCVDQDAEVLHKQEYPMTVDDCFAQSSSKFYFSAAILDKVDAQIKAFNPPLDIGTFVMDSKGRVSFHAHDEGQVQILEHPDCPLPHAYALGIDPIDRDGDSKSLTKRWKTGKGKGKELSDLAFVVQKRKSIMGHPEERDFPVCLFSNRERNVKDAYRQTVYAAIYYNCLINPEENRNNFTSWCEEHRYHHLLARGTHQAAQARITGRAPKYGYHRDDSTKNTVIRLQEEWLEYHWEKLWFGRMAEDYRRFGNHNADLVDAHGAALLLCLWLDKLEGYGRSSEPTARARKDGYLFPVLRNMGGKLVYR